MESSARRCLADGLSQPHRAVRKRSVRANTISHGEYVFYPMQAIHGFLDQIIELLRALMSDGRMLRRASSSRRLPVQGSILEARSRSIPTQLAGIRANIRK
jgi:hypothetical protein